VSFVADLDTEATAGGEELVPTLHSITWQGDRGTPNVAQPIHSASDYSWRWETGQYPGIVDQPENLHISFSISALRGSFGMDSSPPFFGWTTSPALMHIHQVLPDPAPRIRSRRRRSAR
jgi:hypothetical protein